MCRMINQHVEFVNRKFIAAMCTHLTLKHWYLIADMGSQDLMAKVKCLQFTCITKYTNLQEYVHDAYEMRQHPKAS